MKLQVRYRLIERCREAYPVRLMCRCLTSLPAAITGGGIDRPALESVTMSGCSSRSAPCTATVTGSWAVLGSVMSCVIEARAAVGIVSHA